MRVDQLIAMLKTVDPYATVKVNVPGRGYYDLSNDVIVNLPTQDARKSEIILKVE